MEREVTATIYIAMALVLMSALIGIIMYTVVIGNEVKVAAFEGAVDIQESISLGYYKDMVNTNNIMPASAAYSLLLRGENAVIKVRNRITGEIDEPGNIGNCLSSHLTGKVSLEVKKTDTEQYEVVIHKEDCNWFKGEENCGH